MKKLLILSVIITLSACGNKGITLGKTEVISYNSLGNDVADISLKFYENNTFLFNLESIQQPETDEEPIKISEIGTYTTDGSWNQLTFQNQKFILRAIFDEDFLDSNEFRVVDDSTVRINTAKKVIPIWGIACEKK